MTPPAPVHHNPWFGLQVLAAVIVYWSPTLYAVTRGKYGAVRVGLLNFWAFLAVPWLTAWVLALTSCRRIQDYSGTYPPPAPAPPPAPPAGPPPGFEEHTILLPKNSEGTP